MGLSVRIGRTGYCESAVPENFRAEIHVTGDEFEQYVRARLFPENEYALLQTHYNEIKKDDYFASYGEPDFRFKSLISNKEFCVDAKFRSGFYDGFVEWCNIYQLKRYKDIDMRTPVYITIGMGENPAHPDQVFLFPVRKISYMKLYRSFLRAFEIPIDRAVEWEMVK
jgi:hypothetical protein